MKRDMDLIRELMLKLELLDNPFGTTRWLEIWDEPFSFQPTEKDRILGHLKLLKEAGFIDGAPSPMNGNLEFRSITHSGHDFLDSVRDPEIWRKTKDGAAAAGGFTVELVGELAKGLIKTKIKQHTGVDVQ